jgi:hypothetical protein
MTTYNLTKVTPEGIELTVMAARRGNQAALGVITLIKQDAKRGVKEAVSLVRMIQSVLRKIDGELQ